MPTEFKAHFAVGEIIVTDKAKERFDDKELWQCLCRHIDGDWGDVSDEVWNENTDCSLYGGPIVSIYNFPDGRALQVNTMEDRKNTVLSCPIGY